MRTCLLDSITICYLTVFYESKNSDSFGKQIIRLNQPVARVLNEQIEDMIKNGDQNYKEYFQMASTLFPENFIIGNSIKLNDNISELTPRAMSKIFKETRFIEFSNIYKIYQHYSNYEHYGTSSKSLLEFNPEFEFNKLIQAIKFVFQASIEALKIMEIENENIENMLSIYEKALLVNPISE